MEKKLSLFGTAGIRGLFGKKITAELVIKISQIISDMHPNKGMVVGHDARTSSETLAQYASAALSISGSKVYNCGLCSFPVIANLTLKNNHNIAIYITASHNPPEYNGIKLLINGREFTKYEQDLIEKQLDIFKKEINIKHGKWFQIISQKSIDGTYFYKKRIEQIFNIKGDKRDIVIDCANGPMSLLSPLLLSEFGYRVISLNAHVDGSFPGRLSEPVPENLSLLIDTCKKIKAIGVAQDGDGDRFSLIDEDGTYIELSRINALLAKIMLEECGPGTIILSIDSSTTIDKIVNDRHGKIIRTNLGELHTKIIDFIETDKKIIFAAEPWKPIFPEWGMWIDGLYGLLKILEYLERKDMRLSKAMDAIPQNYCKRFSYRLNKEEIDRKYEKCKYAIKTYLDDEQKKILNFDGYRYDMQDGTWILIRKSGTEPKIRLYLESPKKDRFQWINTLVSRLEHIINE